MTRRRKILIAGGVLLLLIMVLIGLNGHHQNAPVGNSATEPEADILSIVTYRGDAKLASLLTAPQLNTAKSNLSTYIHAKYGKDVHTARIDNTVLQNDGGIAFDVTTGNGKTFTAIVYSTDTQFILKVPATNFQASIPQSVILNQTAGSH